MGWRELDIKVFIHPERTPIFHLECPELGLDADNPNAVFNNDGYDGFLLNYMIQEPDHDYSFPNEKRDALWCHKRAGCPTRQSSWGQFKVHEIKPGNKVLVVRNMNQKHDTGSFSYTLRVTKDLHGGGGDFLELDPGGTNNNGPTSKPRLPPAAVFLVGAATGVVATLGTQALLATS